MYALKQLVTAGVRVFFYMEDRERTLDSPTDKIMMSLTAFADELEREKARQRTYDAMARKARAGHVTGGRTFGYDNLRRDTGGVVRVINDAEAAVVRDIFERCAKGQGLRTIAHRLNDGAAVSPRAQQGRLHGWCPSSVREALYRELYRGVIVWNKTRKRNAWGVTEPKDRPEADWVRVDAPELRIVSDEAWTAAHERLTASRATYLRTNRGTLWGSRRRRRVEVSAGRASRVRHLRREPVRHERHARPASSLLLRLHEQSPEGRRAVPEHPAREHAGHRPARDGGGAG